MKKRMAAIAVGAALMGGAAVPVGNAFGASAQGCGQMITLYNSISAQYAAATDPHVKAALLAAGTKLRKKILKKCGV